MSAASRLRERRTNAASRDVAKALRKRADQCCMTGPYINFVTKLPTGDCYKRLPSGSLVKVKSQSNPVQA